jgi:beta-galactosidase/beta-glucuronidase
LNNKPYFQKGVLDQGYWPDGLYTPPCDEAMIYDIQKMKDLGFNMIRKHIKIEPQRWYYHCDRIGMLVWQDMVNGDVNIRAGMLPGWQQLWKERISVQRIQGCI